MNDEAFLEAVRNMRKNGSNQERAGDYWSDEDKKRLREMFELGIGLSEIAIRLQRTEQAVSQQFEKMDLYNRKDNPRRRKNLATYKTCVCHCSACDVEPSLCPQQLSWDEREGSVQNARGV